MAHKLSRELVEKYDLIAYEKLQVKNMVKNRFLAKSITDAGWNLFLTILAYKVEETGKRLVKKQGIQVKYVIHNILKRAEGLGTSLQGAVSMSAVKNWEAPTSN